MKKYWISWEAKAEYGSFTLNSPWWISGYGVDSHPTICAAIKTHMNPDAFIRLSYDKPPHGIQFRFIEEKPDDWSPFSDRFEKADWMRWDETPVLKNIWDKNLKVGDTVRMLYPEKYNFGWIKVSDRLPEHGQFVLCIGTSGVMEVLRCDLGLNNYVFMNQNLTHQVTGITHWQPLPEPPIL